MKASDLFPATYLKTEDLRGNRVRCTVSHCNIEQLGDKDRAVLYFTGKSKGLPLNKTNVVALSEVCGEETDMWAGAVVELYPDTTLYQGKRVPCLRLLVISARPAGTPAPLATLDTDTEGEIPF